MASGRKRVGRAQVSERFCRFLPPRSVIVLYMTISMVVRIFSAISPREHHAMAGRRQIERILRLYPDDCQPAALEPVATAEASAAPSCGASNRTAGRSACAAGPASIPASSGWSSSRPCCGTSTRKASTAIAVAARNPAPSRLRLARRTPVGADALAARPAGLPRTRPAPLGCENALAALARVSPGGGHVFRCPETRPAVSPGIVERRERLARADARRAGRIARRPSPTRLAGTGRPGRHELISLFAAAAPRSSRCSSRPQRIPRRPAALHSRHLASARAVRRRRGQRHRRLRLDAARERGRDVARLLGSLAGDDRPRLAARPGGLSGRSAACRDDELALVSAFDRSTVLMGGLQWLEWIYLERRQFANRPAVLARMDEFLSRLAHACNAGLTYADQLTELAGIAYVEPSSGVFRTYQR